MSASRRRQTPAVSATTTKLAAWIAGAARKPTPAKVTEKTRHHVLDTIAAMVSGAALPPGKMAVSYAATLGGHPEATVVGSRVVTNAVNAAMANGMLAHADETDDSHAPSLTHPGCGIVAGALALAERNRSSGAAFLRAVTLGYDVSARLSFSLNAGAFRETGHSTHSMAPSFGAAAAGAALSGLNPTQVRHVLSYTAQQASGLSCYTRDIDHIEKAYDFGGIPARNGVAAVTMVANGCTGLDDVFSGERNFFVAYDERGRTGKAPQPDLLVKDLGRRYDILDTNIKRWSVGSPVQAVLDSLSALIRQHGVKARDVEDVEVRVSILGAETTDNRDMPSICMQYLCAVMLVDGTVTFDAAHDDARMKDPAIQSLRRRIRLIGDAKLQKLLPARHGIVTLRMSDGRTLRHHTPAVRGTAQNPMTRDEVDEKCFHLFVPLLGRRKARRLCDTVWALEEITDMRRLRTLLQP